MRAFISTDFCVLVCNNQIYTKYAFSSILERYSKYFGEVLLCCPIQKVSEEEIEDFINITNIVNKIFPVRKIDALLHKGNKMIENAVINADIVVGRFPGLIPMWIAGYAKRRKVPFFSEVMGCGWDAYWNHGLVGKIIAPYIFWGMKYILKRSQYALYVTQNFLQKRYPCKNFSVGVSNVVISNLSEGVYKKRQKKIASMNNRCIILMTCAAVDVRYKGQHYVIRAISKLNKMGFQVKYYCVGQGDQSYLKKEAKKYGVEDQVFFTGVVSHDAIFDLLDECDIYIQPSLQEGLPRTVVEAMSRGCPVVGFRTGGIPELIEDECLVKRKSVSGLAKKINMMINNELEQHSQKNFTKASEFKKDVLDRRRNEYFNYIKQDLSLN